MRPLGSGGDKQVDFLLGAEFSWLNPSSWWAIAQVIIGLGFVIFVHELGHFLVAKACGVKCEKFYVGFDFFDIKLGDRVLIPRSLIKWQWGETEYGIGIIPLGGYVKMYGQVDNPAEMEEELRRSLVDKEDAETAEDLSTGLVDRSKLDPRSFMAKSVLQRMAIMSAGVIFNLIFAVFFAAIAFRSGVFFTPPVAGSVTPGGPAWEKNLLGMKPTKIGETEVEGYFTYVDMAQEIALSDGKNPIHIEYTMQGDDEIRSVDVLPKREMTRRAPDLPLIGVSPAFTSKVGKKPTTKYNPAEAAEEPFVGGDLIVELNGVPIDSAHELRRQLALNFDKVANFVVERQVGDEENPETKRVDIQVGRNPFRELGFALTCSPIRAIQVNSPAEKAGLKVDDKILAINGKPIGNIFALDYRLLRLVRENKEVPITVERDGKTVDLKITPEFSGVILPVVEDHPVAIATLGIAMDLTRKVSQVIKGGPADGKLAVGDELKVFEFRLSEEHAKYPGYGGFVSTKGSISNRIRSMLGMELNDQASINFESKKHITPAEVISQVQLLPVGTRYGVVVIRGDEEMTHELEAVASEDYFLYTRGISLQGLQEFYRSEAWGESLQLGFKQTKSDASRIFKFLGKLVTGKISATNLGGPGTIALVATTEASEGTSRLLLFLTLLSANLAIVNFLPIPVLDGGHMVFLAYEGIFRKPVTPQVQEKLMIFGLTFLIILMVSVLVLDAFRIASLF